MSAKSVMEKKAKQSQICFEELKKIAGVKSDIPVNFTLNKKRYWDMLKACFKDNPFPRYRVVLCFLRLKAIFRLFKEEKIVQTGAAAAALTTCAIEAAEIGDIRNKTKSNIEVNCDVAFAGLQVVRLYMMAYEGNKKFSNQRFNSSIRVNNALNGSFFKYQTKDGRYFSSHVYYESQKVKLMKALEIDVDPKTFTMDSLKKDKVTVKNVMGSYNAVDLEEIAFNSGACGCILRDRNEWENSEVGKAVCEMPLFRMKKVADAPLKNYGASNERGPLSGIKVLDLTHIIAGPACSRILAEYGADVLLVRRGKFEEQEQAFLELDGWAGKHSIQLDFNIQEQLERCKDLIKEADVVIYSYQNGVLNKFGLSPADIHQMNKNIIYGSLMCFSDSVWKDRPGWAPLAEDITGLSIRNCSKEKPKNLNGVPLDYIPGFILAIGVLKAIKLSITEGGAYDVTGSLTRTAQWLHECSDICENYKGGEFSSKIVHDFDCKEWESVLQTTENNAVGTVKFPASAIYVSNQSDKKQNMNFTDGNTTWKI